MQLQETIYKRQSVRSYSDTPLDENILDEINEFIKNLKVLNPNIKWSYEIVGKDKIKTIMPWKAPHYILMYSEESENYNENIGFIFQQLDLYLQTMGIGSCWLGMLSPKQIKDSNQKYVIGMSFGKPSGQIIRNKEDFKRKELDEISDYGDEKLVPAQFAPSAGNSQPWYFTHNDDGSYNIYRQKLGFLQRKLYAKFNLVDIGIALAHMYISNEETFSFYIDENAQNVKDFTYIGTFKI